MPKIASLHTKPGTKFEDVCVGDAVGFVDGPGVFPTDNLGVVLGFGEDRWGEYVVVRRNNGQNDQVVSFTTIGIGIYHLPTYILDRARDLLAA